MLVMSRSKASSSTLFRKNMLRKRQDTKTYIFFCCFEKERKKKIAWNILSCARDIHTKATTKKQSNRYTFILLFLVGFWTMHETRNTRKIFKHKKRKIWRRKILRKYWKRSNKNKSLNTNSNLKRFSGIWLRGSWSRLT